MPSSAPGRKSSVIARRVRLGRRRTSGRKKLTVPTKKKKKEGKKASPFATLIYVSHGKECDTKRRTFPPWSTYLTTATVRVLYFLFVRPCLSSKNVPKLAKKKMRTSSATVGKATEWKWNAVPIIMIRFWPTQRRSGRGIGFSLFVFRFYFFFL